MSSNPDRCLSFSALTRDHISGSSSSRDSLPLQPEEEDEDSLREDLVNAVLDLVKSLREFMLNADAQAGKKDGSQRWFNHGLFLCPMLMEDADKETLFFSFQERRILFSS